MLSALPKETQGPWSGYDSPEGERRPHRPLLAFKPILGGFEATFGLVTSMASPCVTCLTWTPSQPLAPPVRCGPTSSERATRTTVDRSASRSPYRPWNPTCASLPRGSDGASLAPTPRCSAPPPPPGHPLRSPRERTSASPPTPTPAMPGCPPRPTQC